ncbi:MAG: fimbrial assembly protein [Methylomonas sp.]|nr:MAG: fimbrial assembly protein [Methylomonas sp.]
MNLDTTIDIDVKKFFQWWGRELAFLVPHRLRQRLRERHGRLIWSPAPQGFVVSLLDDAGETLLQSSIDSSQADSFQQFKIQYPSIEKAEIVLRLSAEQALHKLIYLPAAAQENLQQVVNFELDRYTPFNAEQVYFTLLSLGHTEHQQIRVLLIAVPKLQLDAQMAMLASLGMQPHRVDYAPALSEFPDSDGAYNLLPARFRQQTSKLSQSLQWLMGIVVLVLTCAVLVWPVWQESQAVDNLKARIKQLEKQNRIVDEQQSEIDAVHAETQKLIDIKTQSPALLAVLNELSHLLNDETWLTHMHFADNQLQIQGQSPAASTLISTLEASDHFSNVSFVSPLTQDKTTGRERFQISMTVTAPVKNPDDEASPTDMPDEGQEAMDALPEPETQLDPIDSPAEVNRE